MVGPEEQIATQKFQVYRWRWLVLFAFCAFTFANALAFVQYSPILSLAAQYYNVTDSDIVWFSNCYYITYVVCCLFSIRPLEIRMDISLIVSSFATAVGNNAFIFRGQWLIYFVHQHYYFALIGFILIGIGQTFTLAAPAYISDRWFPMHERTISTSLGSFLNLVGFNFSILYASITFKNVAYYDDIVNEIDQMNLLFSIFTTLAFIFCVLMIRNKPPFPPSVSAASEKILIIQSFKKIFSSLESIIDLMTISMFIGVSWAYIIVISILLAPFDYTIEQIGYASIVYTTTGTISGTIASLYIDYQIKKNAKPYYDQLIKSFLTIAVAGILINALVVTLASDIVIVVLSGIIGFGLNSFMPLALQCYIEKYFPSFELVLTTAIMQMSNLFGFILNQILILPEFAEFGLWVMLVAVGPFYLYLMFSYKTKFLRWEFEQSEGEKNNQQEQEQLQQPTAVQSQQIQAQISEQ